MNQQPYTQWSPPITWNTPVQQLTFVDQWRAPGGVEQPVIVRRIAPVDEINHLNEYFSRIDNQLNVPFSNAPQYYPYQQRGFQDTSNQISSSGMPYSYPGWTTSMPSVPPVQQMQQMQQMHQPVQPVQPMRRRSVSQPLVPSVGEQFNAPLQYEQPRELRNYAQSIPVSGMRSGPVKIPIVTQTSEPVQPSLAPQQRGLQPESRGLHPESLPVKQRGHFIEDDIKRFRHEKEEENELLEKEPLLRSPPRERARALEPELRRFRHEKEEQREYLEENPFSNKSVRERSRLLEPMIGEAELTKHRLRPLLHVDEQFPSKTATTTSDQPHGIIETVKEKATEVLVTAKETVSKAPATVRATLSEGNSVLGSVENYLEKAAEAVIDTVSHLLPGSQEEHITLPGISLLELTDEALVRMDRIMSRWIEERGESKETTLQALNEVEKYAHYIMNYKLPEFKKVESEENILAQQNRLKTKVHTLYVLYNIPQEDVIHANDLKAPRTYGNHPGELDTTESTVVQGESLIPPASTNQNTFTTRTSTSDNPNNVSPTLGESEIKFL